MVAELFLTVFFACFLTVACIVLQIITGAKNSKATEGQGQTAGKPSWLTGTNIDRFETLDQVQRALRDAGLESSNLIIGIDFTKSNEWNGTRTFGGRCLHWLDEAGPGGPALNPYQEVIMTIGETLEPFDDDNMIPAFGFGDSNTQDKEVFSLNPNHAEGLCHGFREVLQYYNETVPRVQLSGPTSFAPLIRDAVDIVRESGNAYHILIIVADGQVTAPRETIAAIVEASNHPLSIVMIGVGDGPWDTMREFDDEIPHRRFDNFQFLEMNAVTHRAENTRAQFALQALMEIPDQYHAIKKLGLLNQKSAAMGN